MAARAEKEQRNKEIARDAMLSDARRFLLHCNAPCGRKPKSDDEN
jgi:hypothetical protein